MIKVGIIGFGRMGRFYLKEMLKSPKWEVVYICDVYEGSLVFHVKEKLVRVLKAFDA